MKSLDDLAALAELCPRAPVETPIAWLSRAKAEGFLNEQDWSNGCAIVKANLYLFK